MPIEMDSITIVGWQTKWIQSLPSNGNQNHFGCHHIQLLPLDGKQKKGNMTNPLLLVSIAHKDGRL